MKIDALNLETAPQASRALMAASAKQLGFLPSPVAKAAGSPTLLAHLLAGFVAFDKSSLGPMEREVVAMTVAFENGCHYCMAMHSAGLARDPANAALVAALRAGEPLADSRLEAIRVLARDLVRNRGDVRSAGDLSERTALDVVLGVGVYQLSTLTNIFTESEIDAPFASFAWTKP